MKLFKRVKAERYVEPEDTLTVGTLDFNAPSSPTMTYTPINSVAQTPYSVFDFPVQEHKALTATPTPAPDFFTVKQKDFVIESDDPKAPPGVVESLLAFMEPAKGGMLKGLWEATVESIEKNLYSQTYCVALRVEMGPDKGKVLVLHAGDKLTINYTMTL